MQEVCGRWRASLPFSILPSIRIRNVCAELFSCFAPRTEMDRTQTGFGRDETKPRGIGAKCFYRLQPSEKTDVRQELLPPSHAGGGGMTPAWLLLARSVKNISSLLKERSKNRRRRHRRTAPASGAGGQSWRKKAEKGSMVQSDTLKYILCLRRNAYSVLLKRIKHASFTDARSSWLERCRALLYSAFIHVATCHLTPLGRVLGCIQVGPEVLDHSQTVSTLPRPE